ncbi:hypothetical protein MmiEs2_05000 [Methanimicrococcus stummii]|uniref:Uncharacterized protein n=1 Tax=Methanimicrococcus stummii TaxID=3028294 RepID=A0AA96V9P7_9EURY|nr:hypothetical protein [Methanimicrococcus sp. Es2]WNY28315.1 hypothetical protein MmiEs2_05000 [Methanimicrococcus sp. Es2]
MADIEKCEVRECPFRNERDECTQEHHAVIYIEYIPDEKRYDAVVFCEMNFYEDEKTRNERRKEILDEIGGA